MPNGRPLHVFDLDGTLLDTFEAQRQSYLKAGLTEYDPANFYKSAADWGCPKDVHERKGSIFPQMLELVTPGWALPAFLDAMTDRPLPVILTGTSPGSIKVLTPLFRSLTGVDLFSYLYMARHSVNFADKRLALRVIASTSEVVYYDDHPEAATLVNGIPNLSLRQPMKARP